jgi:4-amino-4-deoxy-L-arabinose transferase-like glycosyltransferase
MPSLNFQPIFVHYLLTAKTLVIYPSGNSTRGNSTWKRHPALDPNGVHHLQWENRCTSMIRQPIQTMKKTKRKKKYETGTWWIPLIVFIAALAIRLIYLFEISKSATHLVPIVDAENYDTIARMLAADGAMNQKFFWQGFFYPLFLAAVYLVSGGSIIAVKVLQLTLGALTCVLVYILGIRIFDRRTGVLAAAVTALSGPLVFFENELLATGWAAFWSAALLLLILKCERDRSIASYLLLGLCGGLAAITRATFLPFLAAASIWLLVRLYGSVKRRAPVALKGGSLALGFVIITLPVAVLSFQETWQFTFLPQSGAINLYIGNNPDIDTTLMIRPGAEWRDLTRLPTIHGAASGKEDQRYFMDRFRRYVATDPGGYIKGLLKKTVQFLSPRELPRNIDVYIHRRYSRLLSVLVWKVRGFGFPFGLLLPLGLIGLFVHRRRIPPPVYLFLILCPLAIILVFVTSRYRTPVIPVLAVPAAAGFLYLVDVVQSRRWRAAAVAIGVTMSTAVITSLPGPFATERYDYEAEMHCCVGFELSKRERLDEAVLHLEEALRLRPDYGDAHKFLGLIRNRQRRPAEAVEHLRRALELDPDSYLIRYYLGASLTNLGKTEEAVDHLERALEGAKAAKEEALVTRIQALLRSKKTENSPDAP